MAYEDLSGIDPDAITAIDAAHAAVIEEQQQLPLWFKGLPADSEPVVMMETLRAEAVRRAEEGQNGTDLAVVETKLRIMADFHCGYRQLLETGLTPLSAIAFQTESMLAMRKQDSPSYSAYSSDKFDIFIDEITEAYEDFYNPRMTKPSTNPQPPSN